MQDFIINLVKTISTYLASNDFISVDQRFIFEILLNISQFIDKTVKKRKLKEEEKSKSIEKEN